MGRSKASLPCLGTFSAVFERKKALDALWRSLSLFQSAIPILIAIFLKLSRQPALQGATRALTASNIAVPAR
jgi:hypothetical protein